MNNTRWILELNGNYALHDYTLETERVIMKITNMSDGTYYLRCPEMGYSGFDVHSRLKSMTFTDARAEAEGIYEEWLKEQIYYYNNRLNLLFGKTV